MKLSTHFLRAYTLYTHIIEKRNICSHIFLNFLKQFSATTILSAERVRFDNIEATIARAKADTANAEKGQRLLKTRLFEMCR